MKVVELKVSRGGDALYVCASQALEEAMGSSVFMLRIERAPWRINDALTPSPMLECYLASVIKIKSGGPFMLHATLITDWAFDRAIRALTEQKNGELTEIATFNEDTEYGHYRITIKE